MTFLAVISNFFSQIAKRNQFVQTREIFCPVTFTFFTGHGSETTCIAFTDFMPLTKH